MHLSSTRHGPRALPAASLILGTLLAVGTAPLHAQEATAGPQATPVVPSDASLTVYSGRSESLVEPILDRFAAETGIPVQVRYGDSAELAALLLEEGDRSPADVFFAQDAGALGAVAAANLLAPLDPGILERVEPAFRDPGGTWVGISGRARTVAYTTTDPDLRMPDSILDFADPQWRGRIGWVPSNASFQAFVTALRILEGEDGARAWLEGIIANAPIEYPSNTAAVEGVAAGEVDVAFVNHYYLMRLLSEHGDDYPVANHFFDDADPGALVNVAGAGRLATSDERAAADALIASLLGDEAQRYFGETTFEYPLVPGIAADARLPELSTIEAPHVDLSSLSDLKGTVDLLRAVGALD